MQTGGRSLGARTHASYGNLPVGGVEADITVMRPEQVAANAECPGTFVPTALAEGKTIYEHTAIHRPGQSALLALPPTRARRPTPPTGGIDRLTRGASTVPAGRGSNGVRAPLVLLHLP